MQAGSGTGAQKALSRLPTRVGLDTRIPNSAQPPFAKWRVNTDPRSQGHGALGAPTRSPARTQYSKRGGRKDDIALEAGKTSQPGPGKGRSLPIR